MDDEVIIDEFGRPEPPVQADEVTTLLAFLEYQRATFMWRTNGLESAQLAHVVASSTMTLGGMMKHLALVEDYWFCRVLTDAPDVAPWASVDWSIDRDWDWHSAADDSPSELVALWTTTVERARAYVLEVVAHEGLDARARRPFEDGTAPSLRWIVCHMIEEYARHNGHADLIREDIDGLTGE